jgi:hypothetical protein
MPDAVSLYILLHPRPLQRRLAGSKQPLGVDVQNDANNSDMQNPFILLLLLQKQATKLCFTMPCLPARGGAA